MLETRLLVDRIGKIVPPIGLVHQILALISQKLVEERSMMQRAINLLKTFEMLWHRIQLVDQAAICSVIRGNQKIVLISEITAIITSFHLNSIVTKILTLVTIITLLANANQLIFQ